MSWGISTICNEEGEEREISLVETIHLGTTQIFNKKNKGGASRDKN